MIADFLKKTFHIPKFAPGGIIEKPIEDVEVNPPEFVVNMERLDEFVREPEKVLEQLRHTGLKQCPFCGGYVRVIERSASIVTVYTKAECLGCHMVFEYDQDFAFSKKERVAINESFETVWNRRTEDGES